jgi:two-component system alkaline phosphatase synthesis response regulator PhoP
VGAESTVASVPKVLVVDDESSMRFLYRMLLESEGFEVIEACHGAEAVALVKEGRPDLVVTDVMMPVMDGRELIEWLRANEQTAGIPILAISRRGLDAGETFWNLRAA